MKTAAYVSISVVVFLIFLFITRAILPSVASGFLFFVLAFLIEANPRVKKLITPSEKIRKRLFQKHLIAKTIGVVVLVLLLIPLIGVNPAIISGFVLLVYFGQLDSRSPFGAGLLFLFFIPILLLLKKKELAEEAAVAVYYFLIIGVIWQLFELGKDRILKKEADNRSARLLRRSERAKAVEEKRVFWPILFWSSGFVTVLGAVFYLFFFFPKLHFDFLSKMPYAISDINFPQIALFKKQVSATPTVFPFPSEIITPISVSKTEEEIKKLKIFVQNGTEIAGLAASTSAKLEEAGFKSIDVGNAPSQDHLSWKFVLKDENDRFVFLIKEILELENFDATDSAIPTGFDILMIAGEKR